MTEPELKPCPFCGGEANSVLDPSHSTGWDVGCFSGSCEIEPHVWAVHQETAAMQWNTRADLAAKPTLAEALAVPEVKALVEALILARAHVANNEQGWSVGRYAARSDLEIVDAALRQIGGKG